MSEARPPRLIFAPIHFEANLAWLIARCGVRQPRADRRLNAFENSMMLLARTWRPTVPIVPAHEIRMATATQDALLAWIEAEVLCVGPAASRLAVYTAGVLLEEEVPVGWVRLRLTGAGDGVQPWTPPSHL